MEGVQPEACFIFHGGGQALSFYRGWLWLEQACIEGIYLELVDFGASRCIEAEKLAKAYGKKQKVLHAARKKWKSCMMCGGGPA